MPGLALRVRIFTLVVVCLLLATAASAAPPWAQLIPFRSGGGAPVRTASATITRDADFSLTEQHGPWMIMCATFVDKFEADGQTTTGEAQAEALVRELRSKHRLQAYIFRQRFDFTQKEAGLGLNRFGGDKKMKALRPREFDEIAVMVGDFQTVNDPALENTLKAIKKLQPKCMTKDPTQADSKPTQHFATWFSEQYRTLSHKNDPKYQQRGPLGRAFVTKNPLLPDELFVAKGLDPLVIDMNKNLPNSLLRNQKKYTVKVATFRGVDTMKPKEFDKLTSESKHGSKIDEAAEKANKLCAALRKQGVEAYEFHDISESIVTIGSFDSVGEERADGKTEINRAVLAIMEKYKAELINAAQLGGQQGMMLKSIPGCKYNNKDINFDAQPVPVEVPRQSLAANYNSTNSPLR
ncbi:hypothetical protein [Anatilimnocola floriformis]|uniref:hypothetical protein n=1 Tax=Anatilimnocola floriformis TaxID=2948575 RepID=UPI0020C25539|nr:hypothetical protein [Anatilimnocola floriformis]